MGRKATLPSPICEESHMKSRNALITVAAVAGVGLGSFGLAGALGGDEPAPPAVETEEAEAPGDEADDGIDHQFEGEEVGENGDGIPGPDEAAEEANEADDDNEAENESEGDALTGTELEQASAAALAHTGQGTVADAEAEDGGYEVEVVLDDGSEATVLLDADFNVTGEEADAPEGAEDDD